MIDALLLLPLQWFSDEDRSGEEDSGTADEQAAEPEPDEQGSEDSGEDEDSEPKPRAKRPSRRVREAVEADDPDLEKLTPAEMREYVSLLRDRNKKVTSESAKRKRRIREMEAAEKKRREEEEARRREELKENEQHKKLVEEYEPQLDSLKKDFAETQVFLEEELEDALGQLPEDWQDLIPEDMDIRKRIMFARNLKRKVDAQAETRSRQQSNGETRRAAGSGGAQPPTGGGEAPAGSGNRAASMQQIADEMNAAQSIEQLDAVIEKYRRQGVR